MSRPRLPLIACIAILAMQLTILAIDPHATLVSNVCITLMAGTAIAGCVAMAYQNTDSTRRLWWLLASGFLISAVGQIGVTFYQYTSQAYTQTTALTSDFLFFAYGIPILLAVCSGSEDADLKVLVWSDVLQALLAAILVYLQLFSALPAFYKAEPISAKHLMYLYDGENIVLAAAVSLRLMSNPVRSRAFFYRVVAVYLWVYALVALILGYFELTLSLPDGMQDAAWGIPYVALAASLIFVDGLNGSTVRDERRSLKLLLDNLCPLLFTVAVVAMGFRIALRHQVLAFACITLAVLLYGVRAAVLQAEYILSQERVMKATKELMAANDRLMDLSVEDPLTGIKNRREFDRVLQKEWQRAMRARQPLSLLMIDVDFFKSLNDLYGHLEGDRCLRTIAVHMMGRMRRPGDLVARYGGEEFAVILPEISHEGACSIAQELRASIAALCIPHEASAVDNVVTVSIGVSTCRFPETASAEEVVKSADEALYRAKTAGRNQIQSCAVNQTSWSN